VVVVSNSELLEDGSIDELLVASEVDVVVRSVVVLDKRLISNTDRFELLQGLTWLLLCRS
jgi:hypothetical protein